MASRDDILKAIRRRPVIAADLPRLDRPGVWMTFDDRVAKFSELLERVGGRCVLVADWLEVQQQLQVLPVWSNATKRVSLVPEAGADASNVNLNAIEDPHQLEDLDCVVIPGQFAVAENGAIWINDRAIGLKHRVACFLTQHLIIVIKADQIVDNMHQAYERLDQQAEFAQTAYGVFISGPSKTADIEQSLVIGAHGSRSLTVFCLK